MLINKYCVQHKVAWVHASVAQDCGFVKTFLPGQACYACWQGTKQQGAKKSVGIFAPIVSAIAILQANEIVKLILGNAMDAELIYVNNEKNDVRKLVLNRREDCPVCG